MTRGIEELSEEPVGPLDARSLVRLPRNQRERLMEQAAAIVADEYEKDGELTGFETLSEEDHFDDSFDA